MFNKNLLLLTRRFAYQAKNSSERPKRIWGITANLFNNLQETSGDKIISVSLKHPTFLTSTSNQNYYLRQGAFRISFITKGDNQSTERVKPENIVLSIHDAAALAYHIARRLPYRIEMGYQVQGEVPKNIEVNIDLADDCSLVYSTDIDGKKESFNLPPTYTYKLKEYIDSMLPNVAHYQTNLAYKITSENMGGSDRDSRPDEYNYSDLLKGFNVGQ